MRGKVTKSGIYGLFRLDGAPVDLGDAAELGLSTSVEPAAAHARGVDAQAPSAVRQVEDADALTILVGDIEEPEALAAHLNVAPDVPTAMLARLALQRLGSATPLAMIGEWSLLDWRRRERRLTLAQSAGRRDALLFAHQGPRVAVSPDLFQLSRVGWIGTSLDEAGVLFALGRADLRGCRGERTMLTRVRQLEPGACVTIDSDGRRQQSAEVFALPPRRGGSFDEVVEEAELVMRRIMRSRLARTSLPAVLLSGGLDSSLLAWLAAEERRPAQPLLLLTSAAPPGSCVPDETEFARKVAERLGLAIQPVAAPPDADIYRPSDAILGGGNGPILPNRHLLTDAMQTTARQVGATVLINGSHGEMTLSARAWRTTLRGWLRRSAGRLYRRLRPRGPPAPTVGPFHVRLSAARYADLPEPIRAGLDASPAGPPSRAGDRWGYRPGCERLLELANEVYGGALRMDFPYRDLRLLRLFAALPADILPPHARDRGVARTMLTGHVPDSIRLRTLGMPAEPDHNLRLQQQAPAARARIAAFRKADLDEWLDLDWLDGALAKMAERGPEEIYEANETHLTHLAAEFLCWWRRRS